MGIGRVLHPNRRGPYILACAAIGILKALRSIEVASSIDGEAVALFSNNRGAFN